MEKTRQRVGHLWAISGVIQPGWKVASAAAQIIADYPEVYAHLARFGSKGEGFIHPVEELPPSIGY